MPCFLLRLLETVIDTASSLSHIQLFATPWTVAHQAPPSMEFSRQAYWTGLPFPSPGDLPNLGIEPGSPTLWADALLSEPPGNSLLGEASIKNHYMGTSLGVRWLRL